MWELLSLLFILSIIGLLICLIFTADKYSKEKKRNSKPKRPEYKVNHTSESLLRAKEIVEDGKKEMEKRNRENDEIELRYSMFLDKIEEELRPEDILKLTCDVKEWQRNGVSEIEAKKRVIEKAREIKKSYKTIEKEIEIGTLNEDLDEDLLDDWMYQPIDLVVNKKRKSFSFIFDEEVEFLANRAVPDCFYPDDDGIVSFEIPSDIYYEFDKKTGELCLSGKGNMPNYEWGHEKAPAWESFQDRILSIVVGNGITTIGSGVFQYCRNVVSVKLPNTIQKIYNGAFVGCKSLETIHIPEGVISIDFMAFDGCINLKSIILPKSLEEINYSVFGECENLKKIIMYRDTLITDYLGEERRVYKEFECCDAEIVYID